MTRTKLQKSPLKTRRNRTEREKEKDLTVIDLYTHNTRFAFFMWITAKMKTKQMFRNTQIFL